MTIKRLLDAPPLREGQLWKLSRRYVSIVALGEATIEFKFLNSPTETGERSLSSSVDTLWRYLLSRKGRMIKESVG